MDSDQADDTLSYHPMSDTDTSSDAESEKYETISCTVVSNDLTSVINGFMLPVDVKQSIQQKGIKDEPKQDNIRTISKVFDV